MKKTIYQSFKTFTILNLVLVGIIMLAGNSTQAQFRKNKSNGPKTPLFNQQDTLQVLGKSKVYEPKNGRLMDSLTIEAMDGSFVLESGKAFKPTFYTPGWVNPNKDFVKAFKYSTKGRKVKLVMKRNVKYFEDQQKVEKDFTGKEVTKTVKVEKTKTVTETLYGLLEFNTVHDICSNEPTTRAYYISIPDNYIQSAKGGNISVIYEFYQCEPIAKIGKQKYTSWVLWLSDIEF